MKLQTKLPEGFIKYLKQDFKECRIERVKFLYGTFDYSLEEFYEILEGKEVNNNDILKEIDIMISRYNYIIAKKNELALIENQELQNNRIKRKYIKKIKNIATNEELTQAGSLEPDDGKFLA